MVLTLDQQEAELLLHTLQETLQEVRQEIHHTHESDLREKLRHREAILYGLLSRLAVPA